MSNIAFKSYDIASQTITDEGDTGIVEAIVSVFGNVDSVGDITQHGAFAKTLAEWSAKGDPIPFVFSHQWDNPDAYLGAIVDAREVPEGLYVKAQVDLTDPAAAKVHRLLKQRLITQFSFGYIARDWEMKSDSEHGKVRVLTDVQLLEAGPTLLGANTATRLIQAASALLAEKTTAGETAVMEPQTEDTVAETQEMSDNEVTVLPSEVVWLLSRHSEDRDSESIISTNESATATFDTTEHSNQGE